jgi:hypothetical protein
MDFLLFVFVNASASVYNFETVVLGVGMKQIRMKEILWGMKDLGSQN